MKKFLVILLMLVSMNASAQWQPDVRLTNYSANSYTSMYNARCIAANGSLVHTVWYDYRDGNSEIYYKLSTDGGINWGTDTRLTNNSNYSIWPSIACSDTNVHVVWSDDRDINSEIYYKRSTDGGKTWGSDTRLTNAIYYSSYPSIVVSGNFVHVVWTDQRDSNEEIYYKNSTDGGITWGVDTRLTNYYGASSYPTIAISGSLVHVIWEDDRNSTLSTEIYYKRSTDGGITWGSDTRLTNNPESSLSPSIAVSGTIVHIVWYDSRDNNYEIYYKRSTDGGITWGADTRLTNDGSGSLNPSIAVLGNNVHVVWHDGRNGVTEIFYKYSSDNGITWGSDTRLTNSTGRSEYPSVAVSGSLVHVVWNDNRDGNFEIYYKHNPTGNPIGIQNISTETPAKYSLGQNYPNPFNPMCNVQFSMYKAGSVRLVVYDVQGREVQSLVNEKLSAGTYEVKFDGSVLNSGVYFYKMMTDGFTETKRMILIK